MMALIADVRDFFGFDYYRRREMRDRLNLLGVAEAHVLWKTHLGHHIQGSIREPLESALVGQDGICQLGNWIKGQEFEPFRNLPEFHQLKEAHQQFHQSGDAIINKLKVGDLGGADAIFKAEYSRSLRNIIQSLTELNKYLQRQ